MDRKVETAQRIKETEFIAKVAHVQITQGRKEIDIFEKWERGQ